MTMNGDTAGAAIANALNVTDTQAIEAWKTVCNELFSHITNNASVAVPALGLLDSTGSPVTGSATGTVS